MIVTSYHYLKCFSIKSYKTSYTLIRKFISIMTWLYLIGLAALLHLNGVSCDGAFVEVDDNNVTLGNDYFQITFWGNATARSLLVDDVDLIADVDKNLQTWYLDWNGERVYFNPYKVDVLQNSDEEAHVAYIQEASEGLLYIEFHLGEF